jgi:hypothetical protein
MVDDHTGRPPVLSHRPSEDYDPATSFFEPPPPPPSLFVAELAHRQPAWLGPPANVLPAVVGAELLIARTDETAVAVTGIRACPTGFGFTLSLRLRRLSAPPQQDPYPFDLAFEGDRMADTFLRFGVQFADGAKATNLPRYDLHHTDDAEPTPPVLTSHGGGGGTAWDMDQWVWPLPPPGPLAFVCEWPAHQIGESRVELDADLVRQAAERATPLWPDD